MTAPDPFAPRMNSTGDRSLVPLPPEFLMYAFRYALGRASYAVGDVADALIRHRDALHPHWRQQIIRDIDTAIAEERAGMRGDIDRWRHVAEVMADEEDQ